MVSSRVRGSTSILIEVEMVVSPSVVDAVIHAVPPRRASIEPSGLIFIMLSSEEEKIINLLDEPSFIDTIIQRSGLPAQKISALLLDMELKGLVQQQAGKQFIRRGG